MGDVVELVKALAWPIAVLALGFGFRKTLRGLLSRTMKIRYGKLDVLFTEQLRQVESAVGPGPIETDLSHARPTDSKTTKFRKQGRVVSEAWLTLEIVARRKCDQLKGEEVPSELFLKDPVMYISYSGALGPSLSDALFGMKALMNQVAHGTDFSPSSEEAHRFERLVESLKTAIESIQAFPSSRLHALTYVILEINSLIDTGQFDRIPFADVKAAIQSERVLPYLAELSPETVDLSLIIRDSPYPGFAKFYHAQMKDILGGYGGRERRKWGVENRGLCLLLAWTNEIVQRGKGWFHP